MPKRWERTAAPVVACSAGAQEFLLQLKSVRFPSICYLSISVHL